MKAKLIEYDWRSNRATIEFDTEFAEVFERFRDKIIDIAIKLWRPKRSGAANRYMWVLVDKLAAATHTTKNEVYRKEIKEIGGVSDVYIMLDAAVDRFCKHWESQGLGWQTEVVGSHDGRTTVIAYYGSSTFTVEQMTQLIENLIFEAEQYGIDTDTPDAHAFWESLEKEARTKYGES